MPEPRRVAVSIPYTFDETNRQHLLICLVTSRKHENRYVLPKGGIEEGESGRQAAIREMWEEG